MTFIETHSGRRVDLLDPQAGGIEIGDIAHSLTRICRFNGHTEYFYSVAQHSVLVARHCPPEERLAGLMHDATEAYLGDVTRPLKQAMREPNYRESTYDILESQFSQVIGARFGYWAEVTAAIKLQDSRALVTEARDLLTPAIQTHSWRNDFEPYEERIVPLPCVAAESLFLAWFNYLTGNPVPTQGVRSCKRCGIPFLETPGTRRSKREYCEGNPCRLAYYRGRKKRAQELFGVGASIPSIAKKLGAKTDVVRGWVEA